jgi:uncharacterized integral membrane protein (TIGR00697 family)
MTNNTAWILLLIVNYSLIALAFRFFRRQGLFVWITLASILANIQVIKTIELFGFVTTLGNVMYGTSFLATDILSECYGEKEARKGVFIGIFSILATTLIMQVCLQFVPHASDTTSEALQTIFSLLPRIAFASISAYVVSQNFDVWFYAFLKRKYPKLLWLRNNVSTMVSQLLDNSIFTLMAFWGVFNADIIWQIFAATYVMKWVVAILDTPVIYWARAVNQRNPEPNN